MRRLLSGFACVARFVSEISDVQVSLTVIHIATMSQALRATVSPTWTRCSEATLSLCTSRDLSPVLEDLWIFSTHYFMKWMPCAESSFWLGKSVSSRVS